MSGDAQPRKRKDKRRRKEDEELFGHFKNTTDEVIHIQKEAGLGGNICTKVIFFLLLGAIGLTVGLILVEYHGSTDEDVIYNDEAPWNVAIKEWVDYLPVLPDILRGDTDDHHQHSEEPPDGHSEEEHEEELIEEEEEHKEEEIVGGEVEGGGESWLDVGQKWFSELEFDFSLGGSSVVQEGEEGHGEEEREEEGEVDTSVEEEEDKEKEEEEDEGKSEELGENEEEEDEDDEESGKSKEVADEEEEEDDDDDDDEKSEENVDAGQSGEEEEEDEDEENKEQSEGKDDEEEEDEEEEDSLKKDDDDDDNEEQEDLSLEDLGRELTDEDEEEEEVEKDEEEDTSLEDLGRELEEDIIEELEKEAQKKGFEEEEEELDEKEEEDEKDEADADDEDDATILDRRDSGYEEGDRSGEGSAQDEQEEGPQESEEEEETPDDENEQDDIDLKHKGADASEEELFPEAIEALKQEASELLRAQAEAEEKITEKEEILEDEPSPEEDETEGIDANEQITEMKSKEESIETEATSTEVPTFEAVRIPAYTTAPPTPPPPSSVEEEIVQKVVSAPTSAPEPSKQPEVVKTAEPEEVSEEEEEEEEEAGAGDDEIDEDIGLSPKRYQELIEKYGQPTPESSDIEQSDDEAPGVREYSDGGEAESVGEEESANEVEESEPEEVEETYIKVEKPVTTPAPVELESEEEEVEEEEEEEEEESEDEPPPPPPPPAAKKPAPSSKPAETRSRGGPKDVEEDYPNAEITNSEDWAIKEELDMADEEFNFDRVQSAMDKFTLVLTKRPKSPRALYGMARALDLQAEAKSSNTILDKAIDAYRTVIRAPEVPDELFRRVADRLINRLRFRGQHIKAVPVHRELIKKFNNTVRYRNDLAISYLMVNRLEDAGAVFREVLDKWTDDPMARSHYGLVLKLQGKMKECIPHLLAGLSSDDLSTRDARLYFHLGDALTRTGEPDHAMKIYKNGVEKGLFRSKYQRSLYNVDRLTARPWWTHQQTQYQEFFKKLEDNWKHIKEEGLAALKLKGLYQDEAESLRDSGDWKQFELFARGIKYAANCKKTPITCSLIESFPQARTCKRGQTKFSVMSGGTHVWPHCGPTNCRLRGHLGLIVPRGGNIAIRVGDETRKWEEGKVMIFDDSFEHEVWHNGTAARLVLIVDVWHPELTLQEIRSLSPI